MHAETRSSRSRCGGKHADGSSSANSAMSHGQPHLRKALCWYPLLRTTQWGYVGEDLCSYSTFCISSTHPLPHHPSRNSPVLHHWIIPRQEQGPHSRNTRKRQAK